MHRAFIDLTETENTSEIHNCDVFATLCTFKEECTIARKKLEI